MAHRLTRFVAIVLVLAGIGTILGVVVTTLGTRGSHLAGALWFVGLIALLIVPGQLRGRTAAWEIDEGDEDDESETISWVMIPAGLAVMAIGTVVYVL
jgi:hypothetical protein